VTVRKCVYDLDYRLEFTCQCVCQRPCDVVNLWVMCTIEQYLDSSLRCKFPALY